MALIPCPHCGKEVSSHAKRCPGCGNELTPIPVTEFANVVCRECGTHYKKSSEACPNCGEPNNQVAVSVSPEKEEIVVDYDTIFQIKEDDGKKRIVSHYYMSGNYELDSLCERIGTAKPGVYASSLNTNEENQFLFCYDESDLLCALKEKGWEDEYRNLFSPNREVLIFVDGNETIKLQAKDSREGLSAFPFEHDQFLKCCKANKLEVKIIKQNGSSVAICGTKEDEELLIASFQALYSFVVDNTLFHDAVVRTQRWCNKQEAEYLALKQQHEQRAAEIEREESKKVDKSIIIGVGITVIGVILTIVSFGDFETLYFLTIIGMTVALTGVFFLIYGGFRKKGYGKEDAFYKVVKLFNRFFEAFERANK